MAERKRRAKESSLKGDTLGEKHGRVDASSQKDGLCHFSYLLHLPACIAIFIFF